MMSVNMKFACLRRLPTIGDFYDECQHEICLSGTSACYQSLTFKVRKRRVRVVFEILKREESNRSGDC